MPGSPRLPLLRIAAAFSLTLGAAPLLAQAREEPISSSRPGFTTGPETVSRFQVESGYSYREDGAVRIHNLGELLLRIPLASAWELRIEPNSYVVLRGREGEVLGFEDAAVAVKTTLSDGAEGWDPLRPSVGVMVRTVLPTGAAAFRAGGLEPQALLALGWTLGGGAELQADGNVTWTDGEEGGRSSWRAEERSRSPLDGGSAATWSCTPSRRSAPPAGPTSTAASPCCCRTISSSISTAGLA